MKLKKHIAVSESGVLFNGATGDSFSVNPIANDILDMLKKGYSYQKIKASILDNYHVNEDRLESDLYDFFGHLKQLNLIDQGHE